MLKYVGRLITCQRAPPAPRWPELAGVERAVHFPFREMSSRISHPQASVKLSQGLGIGYRSLLAEVSEDIPLENGTHYLLARNGRGKTTLLKPIAGLIKTVAGNFETRGHCQFIGDEFFFDRELKPQSIFKALIPADRRQEAFHLAEQLELDARKEFGQLSFGNRKKVGLVVAEFRLREQEPNLLLYDEPFTGLDTPAREAIRERWEATRDRALRIISCHPDFDSMSMPSALLISDGKIFLGGDGALTWADFKDRLN